MAEQSLNTWQKFYAALRSEAQTDEGAFNAVETIQRAADTYNDKDFQGHIRGVLEKYGERYGFSPQTDWGNIVAESMEIRPREFRPASPETPAPQAPTLQDFLAKKSDDSGGGGESAADKAKKVLYDSQKKATLDAFNALLDQYKNAPDKLPGAIDDFYRTHLSAAGVIGKQYNVLLSQARKLYGKSDEFDKHEDALKKEASESVEKLQAIHQIGPLQDPKDQEQREAELGHLNTFRDSFRTHATNRDALNAALRKNALDAFNAQWAQRGAVIDRFEKELSSIGFSYDDMVRGVSSVVVTTFPELPQEGAPQEEPVPQGAPGQARGRGKAGQLAKGAANKAVKSGERDLENLGKAGAEKVAQAAGTAAAEEAAGATIGELIFDFLISNPIGWAIDIILAILLLFAILIGLFFLILLVTGGKLPLNQPPSSTIIAQNAKTISDNLCKTTIMPGSTVSQRCDSSRGDLYDNINPGAVYPQPKAHFPLFDFSLQNSHFGVQFTKPDGNTYWAYNRPFCTGHCFPWDYRGWGRYWCTDLVMDSYAASGFTAILKWSDPDQGSYTYGWGAGNTSVMIKFFARNSGYSFIPANQFAANKIASGSAIFFKWDNDPRFLGEHTGIVSSVQPDVNHPGFGVVNTLEANAWNRTGHYTYRNNNPGNQIVGFGIKTGK